jgi:hypothetical protein
MLVCWMWKSTWFVIRIEEKPAIKETLIIYEKLKFYEKLIIEDKTDNWR